MPALLPYLQLCRIANVFTALADIFLGYLLTNDSLGPGVQFPLLLGASGGLYLAGMVFNDVFDREVDRQERPGRPIPSGRVSLRAAIQLGTALLVTGCVCAALVGMQSLAVAGLLVICIFLYDGVLKNTVIGPLAMGSCRFLNVMLGASAAGASYGQQATAETVWHNPQLHVAAALGIYIAGVTWFARSEAGQSHRLKLGASLLVMNLGLALLLAFAIHSPDPTGRGMGVSVVLGLIAVTINRRATQSIFDPSPQNVQFSIKTFLMSLVMLDATLVLFAQPRIAYSLCVVALLIPAMTLARRIPMT